MYSGWEGSKAPQTTNGQDVEPWVTEKNGAAEAVGDATVMKKLHGAGV